ncbi:hypothetical protein FOMG_02207 [Fusarium oxysporum f. sp. melonis 26406]|uniref:Uncharacterized protein n=1 Tax=Fusarium oxysporum f. sp. melonis 26406 TaxID=1089452 RepID=X0B986_FUSOX|nr:hypothetical protein FOMG_02207 [Fusarium oxysporum f. sp. melonis 26406]
MSTDPLRLDDFIHRLIYEKGYKTWSSLLKKATKDPEIPSASLRVPGTGSCDLPPFEQPFRILPRVATPTRLFTSTKLPLPPSVWFKQSDNHLTVLVLAWAYALSARRAEIFSQALPLEYTDSQAEWLATRTCDNTEATVDVGNISYDAARWWAGVIPPGQG